MVRVGKVKGSGGKSGRTEWGAGGRCGKIGVEEGVAVRTWEGEA